jgi:hypothetical protein
MKSFYSAEDVENIAARGQQEIILDSNTVLTDLAKHTANVLGIRITTKSSGFSLPVAARSTGSQASVNASSLGAKPKGCQNRPNGNQQPAHAASSQQPNQQSNQVVDKLIEAVKRINGK